MTSRSLVLVSVRALVGFAMIAIATLPAGGCIGVSAKSKVGPGGTPPIKRCRAFRVADDGALDDFEDGNTQILVQDGRDGYWHIIRDNSGGQLSMQEPPVPESGGANVPGTVASVGRILVQAPAELATGLVSPTDRFLCVRITTGGHKLPPNLRVRAVFPLGTL